eukprot:TRINITY_DN4378_c0_g1_i1.p2 TRINITY_DN4378_c0_g1~~TRINITY_DN4378_c0_g1_i1.p2  ORF type:complete len:113 (-),score=13.57 TRINITY_DN4378_c0_g1_i1:151-489(-)
MRHSQWAGRLLHSPSLLARNIAVPCVCYSSTLGDVRFDRDPHSGVPPPFLPLPLSKPTAALTKEAVNQSYESSLEEGLHFERRLFHSTFATNDQKEGMKAFVEKRQADFTDS